MTSMWDMAEHIAAEEARLRDKGIFKRGPDPDRVAKHLATSEPKWGIERRKRIVVALAGRPVDDLARFEVINYTRKQCGALNLRHFFDVVADETMMRHVERILKL